MLYWCSLILTVRISCILYIRSYKTVPSCVTNIFISLSTAMVSFESTDGSGSTIQVTESDGSLEVVLVLSKPVNVEVTVFVVATNVTATGLHDLFCIFNNNYLFIFIILYICA